MVCSSGKITIEELPVTEGFLLIGGRLRVRFADLESGSDGEMEIHRGMRVTIHPCCAHLFTAVEDAQVIEYYDAVYDPDDDRRYNFSREPAISG